MITEQHKLIVTIVNKGKSGKVLDVSHKAGAVGGTVIYGHRAAVRLLLGISIDPEKEIVLTLIEEAKARTVIDAIAKELDLDQPNKGIAFILDLDHVVGLSVSD
ncbi:MAG: P-II family nitrogen regulator [Peptococcaceae bacterium]|nr:P-II family nitrogen regulator [Peptococcaceae bacterium]